MKMSKNVICCIPANNNGDKLFIKDYRTSDDRHFVKYKSTYNNIPFRDTEIYATENGVVICGEDGTVIWRFDVKWIQKLM